MEFRKELLRRFKNLITSGDEIYSDYTVEVEDKIFPCHRFVLSACSPFFLGLLRSDMREKERDGVLLSNMSSQTFKVIYGFLYHHDNGLTADNILDVWKAADFLQIDFIVTACQQIALDNINEGNCHKYYWHGKLLDQNLTAKILKLITCNFDQFKDSQCVMELEGEDLLKIVRDTNLNTIREEYVVDTILKWVSHSTGEKYLHKAAISGKVNQAVESGPNSLESMTMPCGDDSLRTDYLERLLSVSRLTTLSEDFLKKLLLHQHIVDNASARDLINKAMKYHSDYRHSYRPTCACLRTGGPRNDVILMPAPSTPIVLFNLTKINKLGNLNSSGLPVGPVLTVHKRELYACCYMDMSEDSLSLFTKVDCTWQYVTYLRFYDNLPPHEFHAGHNTLWAYSIGEYVFVVHAKRRIIFNCDPVKRIDLTPLTSVPTETPIAYATTHESLILVICGTQNGPATLNAYDTVKQEWAAPVTLEGVRALEIVSFQKEDNLYFITKDYKLYAVGTVEGGVTLNHVTTFSNIGKPLIGALVYCEDLFLFVYGEYEWLPFRELYNNVITFPELFNKVRVIVSQKRCTSLVTGRSP